MNPISQAEVEAEIMRLSELAEKVTHELVKVARTAAEGEARYKAAHARAFMAADGSVQARTAQADIDCDEAFLTRRLSEAELLGSQEAGRMIRARLDALRSINANLRPLVTS